jgi:chromosome segregation ATPase
MLSAEEIQQIIAQNESLQAEVKELNEILEIKAEEISEFKKYISQDTELRSMLDMQLDELQMMQNRIGKHQQKAAGAEEREFELQQELTEAAKVNQQYSELFKQHTYLTTQFEDVQEQLTKVKKRNNMLQQIAVQIGEMESNMEILTQERDELKTKVAELEKMQTT